ncbi:ABC transporter substrate-binding protein [Paenibacillus sp. GCM10012307]|uniref:Extracellular solute-binding protein n=1 Tax=Paenibacillus roseus TaxID=2798579 RepID=A0A934MSV4_9BACL|nr:ABC transporter substrate-binding protein [Paenibacillus roseus]MBJ6364328.1 extracellular solute-binding protein [Paenibacillus roseus]
MIKFRIAALSIMVVMSLMLSACGTSSNNAGTGKTNNAGGSSTTSEATATATDSSTNAGGTDTVKLSGKVVIYSPNNADINNPIVKEFQERTGVQVELIAGGTGELLKRVEAEKDNPLGDVFFGGDTASLGAYSDYFEPFETKEKANLNPAYLPASKLYTPFTLLPMVIMYNKELVAAGEEPASWKDLLDPKWKGKIAFADPGKSSSSFTQLATMLTAFGKDDEKGWEFVQKLVANLDSKLLSSSGSVYKGVADKEFAIGITLEEAALRYVEGGAPVGIVYPSEGTVVTPDGMAVIKGSKNMDNAKAFIDFAAGQDVQALLQKEFFRRSVRTDAGAISGLPDISSIKTVDYDYGWVTANKTAINERFAKVVTGQ